jgi:hydroxyacylglutathione hydrolase
VQVAPGIHIVVGPDHGIGDHFDCTMYAVETAVGTLLFDAGAGRDPAILLHAINAAALSKPVVALFLTHAHADHSGGAAIIGEAFGVQIMAGKMTAGIVASGDEAKMSLYRARQAGIYPANYCFTRCLAVPVEDSQLLEFGETSIRPIATPGHSADHMSYLVSSANFRALIVGDALFDGGRVTLQDTWDCSVPHTCDSIRRLSKEDFELFLPGHGPISTIGGMAHVTSAMSRVAALLCPALYA